MKPSKIRTEFLSLNDPALRTLTCYPWCWSCSNVQIYNQSNCFITVILFLHFCVPFFFVVRWFLFGTKRNWLYKHYIIDIICWVSSRSNHYRLTWFPSYHNSIFFFFTMEFSIILGERKKINILQPVLNWWTSSKTVQETNDYRRPLSQGIFIRLGLKKTYLMCCFYCASSVRVSGPHLVNELQAARIAVTLKS